MSSSFLDKIRDLRAILDGLDREVLLEVDGGIKVENIGKVAEAGTDAFVAGSAIFGSDDYVQTIARMRAEMKSALGSRHPRGGGDPTD